ncbi:MAG: SBBP repeat-containing protein, partial [Fimbriimonadaceae bacterium]
MRLFWEEVFKSVRNNTAIRISAAATAVLALSVVIATRMPANAAPVKKNAVMAGKSGGRAFASKPVQPGTFLENKGQWGNEARFLLGSPGLNMWVTDKGIRYDFARFTQKPKMSKDQTYIQSAGKVSGHVVDLEFVGSSKTARAVGVLPTPGTYNYVRATGTYTGAQGFAETRIAGLYAGVDLRSYLDKGNPRFDVIVSPGADPKDVKFRYAGATNTRIGDSNTVYFTTRFGEVKVADLFAYQNSGANRSQVDCSFKKNADGTFGFAVGNYDESKPLVIDPIVYSTVFGGFAPPLTNLGIDGARGVAVDAFNNAYVTGFTNSPNYPATNGAYDNQVSGFDCFITKFRSDATNLVYSTFLGGTGTDQGLSITVDTQLRAIVAGATDSSGGGGTAVPFPTTPGAPQEIYGGGTTDAFLVRLSSNGANLEFGTFLGGSSPLFPIPPPGDIAFGVGVDGANNMYVVGQAVMPDFPTTAAVIQPGFGGSTSDGFAARISEAGFMDYCTFLGGTGGDVATAVVVDNVGYAHVAGNTASPNFSTTAGSFDTSVQQQDGFICKINPSGTAFDFSTVLGGSSNEAISGIALDQQGNSYVCGASTSNDFPRTAGCYDDIYNPDFENFVTKVAIDGTSLVYSTFMNGANTQRGIGVDDLGVAYIVGNFGGALATSANGDDRTYNGPPLFVLGDAYIQALDEAGSNLLFGSFYGGRNEDGGFAVAVDRSRNAYIVGSTNSDPDNQGLQGFPTTPGSFKETVSVDGLPPFDDGFLMKLKVRSTPLLQSIVIAPASIAGTENTTATLTLTGPASPGGAVIRLASNNEAVARPVDALGNLLDLIVIPEGATTTTFAISSSDVVSNFVVQISAELEGDTKRANVT